MTRDELPTCWRGRNPMCSACQCSFDTITHGPCGQQRAWKWPSAESTQANVLCREEHGFDCCTSGARSVAGQDTWIASYVRTKLRTMAGDAFLISRHTVDCIANALQGRFLSDVDTVLQRILDFAALRCLHEGSSTVTMDDIKVALHSAAPPHL